MSQANECQEIELKWKWASDFSFLLFVETMPSESTTEKILQAHSCLAQDRQIENLHPGFCSILVDLAPSSPYKDQTRILARLNELIKLPTPRHSPRQVEIPVTYDGEDLDEVSSLTGLSVQDIIQLHSSANYRVAFLGFSPGFPYLLGLPEKLWCPRKSTPRIRIPAGSVAIAGSQAGIYPTATPGGWQILGTTQEPLLSPGQNLPTKLLPGDRVRFIPTPAATRKQINCTKDANDDPFLGKIRILSGSKFVSVQGAERPGLTHLGISPGGAADPLAFSFSNQLLGNSSGSLALELCGPEIAFQFLKSTWFSVTGATYRITLDEQQIAMWTSLPVSAGQILRLETSGVNLRSYLSIYGGFDSSVNPVAPPRFRRVKKEISQQYSAAFECLRLTPGLQLDWFEDWSIETFYSEAFGVSWEISRQGIRLNDAHLGLKEKFKKLEMISEGISNGAIQIAPSGSPMILFCDQRTTGGYPKIANVIRADLFKLGQLYPGQRVRFKQVSLEDAWSIYEEFQIHLSNAIEEF